MAVGPYERMQKALKAVQDAQAAGDPGKLFDANQELKHAQAAMGNALFPPAKRSGGRGGGGGGVPSMRGLFGPHQMSAYIKRNLPAALASGNEDLVEDMMVKLDRAQRIIERSSQRGAEGITPQALMNAGLDAYSLAQMMEPGHRASPAGIIRGSYALGRIGANILQNPMVGKGATGLARHLFGQGTGAAVGKFFGIGQGQSAVQRAAQIAGVNIPTTMGAAAGAGGAAAGGGAAGSTVASSLAQMFGAAGSAGGGGLGQLLGGLMGQGGAAVATGAGAAGAAGAGGAGAAAAGAAGAAAGMSGAAALAAIAAPVAIAVGVFLVAVKLFTDNLVSSAKELTRFQEAMQISGGTAGTTSFLTALGMDPSAVPGMAAHARQAMAKDPYAMIAGGRIGMPTQMDRKLAGTTDEAAFLGELIRRTAELATVEERLTTLRAFEMESMLPLIEVYRRHQREVQTSAQAQEAVTTAYGEDAQDFMFQMNRLGQSIGRFLQALAGPWLDNAAGGMGMLADAFDGLTQLAVLLRPAIMSITYMFTGLFGILLLLGDVTTRFWRILSLGLDILADPMNAKLREQNLKKMDEVALGTLGISSGNKAHDDAMRAHTKALQDHGTAIKQVGQHGGGQRAGDALPTDLRGDALRKRLRNQEIMLGAWD
jgi:hypothetical protein